MWLLSKPVRLKKRNKLFQTIFSVQKFQVLSSGTPYSSLSGTKTRLNDVFATDLALRNGEYKERSGNQVFNGLQATVMN